MRRHLLLVSLFATAVRGLAGELPPPSPAPADLVTASRDRHALTRPMPGLTPAQRLELSVGRSFFRSPWVSAPSTTTARDGLGPRFNAHSCVACHSNNGRGATPYGGETNHGLLLRLSEAAADRPHSRLGYQLQTRSTAGTASEGAFRVRFESRTVTFSDGYRVTLRHPIFSVVDNAGNAVPDVAVSPRLAPPLVGIGLLAAVPDDALTALADAQDSNGDGISGRINRVPNASTGGEAIGRFGWKAGQPSVAQQVAAAFEADIGISSAPRQGTTGEPEISGRLLAAVGNYIVHLAIPAFDGAEKQVQGWQLFRHAGCHGCHTPTLQTGPHGVEQLADRTFHPYTDLLLHAMGEGLADHRREHGADSREWRTAPLWGVGLCRTIAVECAFLHDGRARTLLEAILWHGGEAQPAANAVLAMNADERSALIRFLESL